MSITRLSHDASPVGIPNPAIPESQSGEAPSLLMRRLMLALPTLATAAAISWLALSAYGRPDGVLGWAVLVLFGLVMTWQSFVAWQYVYGLVAAGLGDAAKSAIEIRSATVPATASGLSRTAAVVAIHAEDAVAVFAALRVMARSLQRGGGDGSRYRHLRPLRHA